MSQRQPGVILVAELLPPRESLDVQRVRLVRAKVCRHAPTSAAATFPDVHALAVSATTSPLNIVLFSPALTTLAEYRTRLPLSATVLAVSSWRFVRALAGAVDCIVLVL